VTIKTHLSSAEFLIKSYSAVIFAAKPDDADKPSVFQPFPAVCSGESMIQDWLSLHLSRLLPMQQTVFI